MSKSRGNVVDPFDRIDRYSADGLRYFLLRNGVPHSDGNYSDKHVVECINSELVNTLGNLLSRSSGTSINPGQVVPPFHMDSFKQRASQEEVNMLEALQRLPGSVDGHYRDFNIYKGIDAVMAQLHQTNAFIQTHKPWELKKKPEEEKWLECVLAVSMETLRVVGILLQPVVPDISARLLNRLNVPESERTFCDAQPAFSAVSKRLGRNDGVLISRIKT